MSYFSLVSRKVRSFSSASSSRSCTRRWRASFWVSCWALWLAASLASLTEFSSFSTSSSSSWLRWLSDVISCSLDRFSCSRVLTLAFSSSTFSWASSASTRRAFMRWNIEGQHGDRVVVLTERCKADMQIRREAGSFELPRQAGVHGDSPP